MTATQGGLTPEDNVELLSLVVEVRGLDHRAEEKQWLRAKRELVTEMLRRPLLVAIDGAVPAVRPGPEGGLLVAFTDDEAAQAWTDQQHPAAPPVNVALTSRLSDREGRQLWVEWFAQLEVVAVVVNPSGPFGFVASAEECQKMRAPLLRRRGQRPDLPEWVDLGARAHERRRVAELHAAMRAALPDGDEEQLEGLWRDMSEHNRLGSPMWGAEAQILSGHWRLDRGETYLGILQLLQGGMFFGRFGDPYRAIDELIDAGLRLIAFAQEGVDDPEHPGYVRAYLADAARVLPLLTTGYRASDIAPFARWRSDAPAEG